MRKNKHLRKHPVPSKKNKELIAKYLRSKTDCRPRTLKNNETLLNIFAGELGKPMDKATQDDVLDFVTDFKKEAKETSVALMITILKSFYKWLYSQKNPKYKKKGKYPPIVEDLKRPTINRNGHKEYPSAEELIKIIAGCERPRDKALIATAYETGTGGRADKELLNFKISDITIKNNCAYIVIRQSKTLTRTTVVKKFISELRAWLEAHPKANDPDAWLWPSKYNDRMTYSGAARIFKKACERVGVKSYSLRSLRHRRAKDLENVLSIREKMAYFGWSSINTAQVYGSFTSEEACERIEANEEGREIKREVELKKWICPACNTENSPAARFCMNCTQPKDDVTAIKGISFASIDEDFKKTIAFGILNSPAFREELRKEIREALSWDGSVVTDSVAKQKIKTEV